jgi:hypothetical protein
VVVLQGITNMVNLLHHQVDHQVAFPPALRPAYHKSVVLLVAHSPPGLWEVEPQRDSLVVDLKDQNVSRVELKVGPVAFQAEQVLYLVAKVVQMKGHMMKVIILLFLVSLAPTTPSFLTFP